MQATKMLRHTITLAVCVGLLSLGVQAATFTVTSTSDIGAGSLREAVASANNTTGNDIILFDAGVFNTPQTINLQEEISVGGNGNLEIIGPGVDLVTITIFNPSPTLPTKYAFRVTSAQFTLSKVKVWGVFIVTGASAIIEQVSFNNLGFVNQGMATVSNSLFNGCSSRVSGGAISNSGTMTLNRSIISSNSAGNGGGIGNFSGNLTINESVIRDNFVTTGINLGDGGGVYNSGGTTTINNSLLTGNRTVDGDGGGIYVFSGTVNVVNSTISGNTAQGGANNGNGGGIYCTGFAGMSLTNVTVVSNLASQSNNNITSTGGFVSARNSLLADFRGTLMSQGYNLIANITNTTISGTTTGNQLNVNPQIASLANNGGITQTHALLSNSPAINAGNNALAIDISSNPLRFDQRGACFRRMVGTVDIGAFEVQATANPSCNRTFDFYGDGTSDLALFRPENGDWHIRNTVGGTIETIHFGLTGDIPQAADYDGDGRTDLAVYRPSTGTWYVLRSSDGNAIIAQFGVAEDKPVAADYDGDGRAELAVYRPSVGVWWIFNPVSFNVRVQQFGITEDKPVPQDFDGDGRADIAVFRPSTGVWWILNSNDNTVRSIQWGVTEDKPVAGDYDADGRADLAVWRPSSGIWYALRSSNNTLLALQWGTSVDVPQPGDFDGDNRNDFIVWRASQTTWYILQSSNNAVTTSVFGNNTDIAVSSPYRIE